MIEWNSKVLCDEVIFVEWNPSPDRPLLSTVLTADYPNLSCYVVPAEIHEAMCANSRMPVMEYFAKNVEIRRAKSEYICATNSDILWDRNVRGTGWLLDRRSVVRTRRKELRWDGSAPSQKYLRNPRNLIQYRLGWRQDPAYGCGDFTMAHKSLWHRARGYDESMKNERISCDGRGLFQLLKVGGKRYCTWDFITISFTKVRRLVPATSHMAESSSTGKISLTKTLLAGGLAIALKNRLASASGN